MNDNYRIQGFTYLPPVVKNLLIINAIIFLADISLQSMGINLTDYLGLHYVGTEHFIPTQYVSYLFMHANFSHIFFNMFALWMFGYALENYWGSKRFLFYYLFTGIGAGLIQNLVVGYEAYSLMQGYAPQVIEHFLNNSVVIGASGAVFGILLAFGMSFPNTLIYLYFFIPIKAKWFVIIYGVIELFSGIQGSTSNIAHFAHLGGMLFGVLLILWWRRSGKVW